MKGCFAVSGSVVFLAGGESPPPPPPSFLNLPIVVATVMICVCLPVLMYCSGKSAHKKEHLFSRLGCCCLAANVIMSTH